MYYRKMPPGRANNPRNLHQNWNERSSISRHRNRETPFSRQRSFILPNRSLLRPRVILLRPVRFGDRMFVSSRINRTSSWFGNRIERPRCRRNLETKKKGRAAVVSSDYYCSISRLPCCTTTATSSRLIIIRCTVLISRGVFFLISRWIICFLWTSGRANPSSFAIS
jgi:hypothetical protein